MLTNKKKLLFFLFISTFIYAENSPKIGLVLSGGGSKGFAHIAILKALAYMKSWLPRFSAILTINFFLYLIISKYTFYRLFNVI